MGYYLFFKPAELFFSGNGCRYYGKSKPYRKNLTDHMHFLTSEQAMADYAELIFELKAELKAEDSAVVGFGGSYGEVSWFAAFSFFQRASKALAIPVTPKFQPTCCQ